MNNKKFTIMEMENIFEIGRNIEAMVRNEEIEVDDSKEAFVFALKLAEEFEKEHAYTEDYYFDLDEFVVEKILEEYGVEE